MRQGKMIRVRFGIAALVLLLTSLGAFAGTTGGYLGVYTSDINAAMLEALDFEEDGILVNDVIKKTPAAEAGLKAGDIIMQVNDRKMISTKSLKRALWRVDPGEEVTLMIWRDGKKKNVKVKVAEKPEKEHFGHSFVFGNDMEGSWSTSTKTRPFLGVELDKLNDQLAEYFGVEEGEGALISRIVEDSGAEKAGLKAGDVILTVAGDEIEDTGDVSDAIRDKEPGEEVEVVVMREKKKMTIKATLGERESNIYFNPGTVGYMMKDVIREIPDINVELDDLREEIKGLKVKVNELAD
ncbi:PDZ domain-containing protein [bacterium]|nr:PDZ domain-containing protein [bacterium]